MFMHVFQLLQSCLTLWYFVDCSPPDSVCRSPDDDIWCGAYFHLLIYYLHIFFGVAYIQNFQFSSDQSLSHVQLFVTPWTAAWQASMSITNSQSLLKLMCIELVIPSNHFILSSPSPAFNHSQHQGLFQWVSSSHQMAKLLEFQLKHQSFWWMFRTDFLRLDWLDLLAGQGTFKNILQHHTWKASILQCSVLFIVQFSHPYMTTGKTIALTRWNFVGKVMSLLFNMLSRLVITFLLRSKHLLISWMQSLSAVILEPKKIKSVTVSIVSPSICHKVMGLDAMMLVFWMLSFKATFSLFSFTFIKRFFSSSLLSAIRVVSSAYLKLLIFLLAILIPACDLPSPAFTMMYSVYKLNKQHDTVQPWHTPFPIWNQSVVPCPVLTVASWSKRGFLRRQVRWSGIPISFRIFRSLLWYTHSKALA